MFRGSETTARQSALDLLPDNEAFELMKKRFVFEHLSDGEIVQILKDKEAYDEVNWLILGSISAREPDYIFSI